MDELRTITDHTPRDIAGWHNCLDVIGEFLVYPLSQKTTLGLFFYGEFEM